MSLHRLVNVAMAASFAAAAVAWWMKDLLPPSEKLQVQLDAEPKQVRVNRPAISTSVNGVEYRIQPRHSYDMSALVVFVLSLLTWMLLPPKLND